MAAQPLQFKRGDLVRWSSQARGTWRHHVGVVVLVVPPGVHLRSIVGALEERYSMRALQRMGGPRADVSYLVAAMGEGTRGKARLHWPHASKLSPYSKEPDHA